jgi:predicted negative regulator of RcsB-dependent stress response/chorismate mutase
VHKRLLLPVLWFSAQLLAGTASAGDDQWFKTRLLLGEIQFNAQQGKHLDALTRIDHFNGASENRLNHAIEKLQSGSSLPVMRVDEIELAYRMSQRAGNAVRAVLGDDIDQAGRNRAAFDLAQIYYDKQQYDYAIYALQLIRGELFYPFKQDVEFLQAQVAARQGKFEQAEKLLNTLKSDQRYSAYATFNLGHILLEQGRAEEGYAQLAEVGNFKTQDRILLALKDKANLVLGYHALEQGDAARAKQLLGTVRLNGAFSNKALLGSGWASMTLQDYRAALTPWSELVTRQQTDESVQEALLALPYAYGKLDLYANAIELYQSAITNFETSLARLDASIDSISDGKFLQLLRLHNNRSDSGWLLRLRELPQTPETYYLMELLASRNFQESVHNYIDMVEIQNRLDEWARTVTALQNLVEVRGQHYEGLLTTLDASLDEVDTGLAAANQRQQTLADTIAQINPKNYHEYLTSEHESAMLASLQDLEAASSDLPATEAETSRQRVKRARGVIEWDLMSEYPARLDVISTEQREIGALLQSLTQSRDDVAGLRSGARKSYRGYDVPLQTLKEKLRSLSERLETTLAEQAELIESMAVEELQLRVKLLQTYLVTARYELAKNYDLTSAVDR